MLLDDVVHDGLPAPLVDVTVVLLVSAVLRHVMLKASVVLLSEVAQDTLFAPRMNDKIVQMLDAVRLAPNM